MSGGMRRQNTIFLHIIPPPFSRIFFNLNDSKNVPVVPGRILVLMTFLVYSCLYF